ncbi:hypothetical protein [Acanthamoeba polyphaga mimivirus]|nr:hypothetical protein [Acanthamoeba castellanii mamavirus]UMZ07818.1 hypothetical protein [Acanthamoeba polyphaga mimivirus]
MPYNFNKMLELIDKFELESTIYKNKRWIEIGCFMDKIVVEIHKDKYKNLINFNTDDIKIIGKNAYMTDKRAYEYAKKLYSHPEHHNVHQVLGLVGRFKKKQEIMTLAIIYDHFRGQYNMQYQSPELDFKIDTNLVIESGLTGGLAIEVDEGGHGAYKPTDHEDRQRILEACGYYFVRIKPGELSNKQLISLIEDKINEYQLIYTKEIDPEALWKALNSKSIDRQFFDIIGKSIVSAKKFCVLFDDLVKFLGYSQRCDAIHKLRCNYRDKKDYLDLSKDELESHIDEISFTEGQTLTRHGGHNKRYIFLTKFSAYSFIIECQTAKAKEIRCHVIDVYNKYHELLMYCKQLHTQKNITNARDKSNQLYQQRQELKFDEYKQSKQREVKSLNETIKELKRQNDKLEEQSITYLHEANKYKKLYQNMENKFSSKNKELNKTIKELNKSKKNLTNLVNEIPNNNIKRKIKKEINRLGIINTTTSNY